jgi:indolepyruvate ferredoxin oxidoreductase beta subunit
MQVKTTRFSGFIRLRLLAAAKRWRRGNLRHAHEMAWLASWLDHITRALDIAPEAAVEIAETAKIVRGYGSTYTRGMRNWRLIAGEMIAPCLDGRLPAGLLADGVLQARLASLKDPEGQALDRVVESFQKAAKG